MKKKYTPSLSSKKSRIHDLVLSWRTGQIVVSPVSKAERAGVQAADPRDLVVIHAGNLKSGAGGSVKERANPLHGALLVWLRPRGRGGRRHPNQESVHPEARRLLQLGPHRDKASFRASLPRFSTSTGCRGCESLAHGDTAVDKQPFFADMAAYYY